MKPTRYREDVVQVKDAHGTYTARCCGKVASCTHSSVRAAKNAAGKAFGVDPEQIRLEEIQCLHCFVVYMAKYGTEI